MKKTALALTLLTAAVTMLPENAMATVTTTTTDFMSLYHLGPATLGGQWQIPDDTTSLKSGSAPIWQYGTAIKSTMPNTPGAFTINTPGYYEISYGVCSKSGGKVSIFYYGPVLANNGILPQSRISIPPNEGIMATHSFIMYISSGSLELWNEGPNILTLDGPADCVTAFLNVKKL